MTRTSTMVLLYISGKPSITSFITSVFSGSCPISEYFAETRLTNESSFLKPKALSVFAIFLFCSLHLLIIHSWECNLEKLFGKKKKTIA